MIIGITGGSGSGKSAISAFLKAKGFLIIDADEIAHNIIKKGNKAYIEILKIFGNAILDNLDEIDRKKLGNIVFNDKNKLNLLTDCTHKHIIIEIKTIINNNLTKNILIDAPLLVESGLNKIVDEAWVVYSDISLRIDRIMERDNITYEQAKKRIECQMDWDKLKSYADRIIYNNDDFNFTIKQIEQILNDLNKLKEENL